MILGELLNPSGPQLAQIRDANSDTYPHRIVVRFRERINSKHLEECLTGGQRSVKTRYY